MYTSADSVFQIAAHEDAAPLRIYMNTAVLQEKSSQENTVWEE